MTNGKQVWIAVAAAAVALILTISSVETVPPRSRTAVALHISKMRILRYARKHNALPPSIAATEAIAGRNNSSKDGWGRELSYLIYANGDVVLASMGRDAKPGGAGDDADMLGMFSPHAADGAWADELSEWSVDPSRDSRQNEGGEPMEPAHQPDADTARLQDR
jgi:hypothetical protein